jgi:hypothetical protein
MKPGPVPNLAEVPVEIAIQPAANPNDQQILKFFIIYNHSFLSLCFHV